MVKVEYICNMEHFIKNIQIKNFKSINDLKIDGLKRINLFVGKPNVGKSNILEAFGLFSLPFLKLQASSKRNLSSFIRANSLNELFFNGNIEKDIIIKSSVGEIVANTKNKLFDNYEQSELEIKLSLKNSDTSITINNDLKVDLTGNDVNTNPIKYYLFKEHKSSKKIKLPFLLPPFGDNLMSTIENKLKLKNEIYDLFSEYGLKLVFDKASEEMKIMRDSNTKEVFLIPFSSIADTLQRVIFYKTAIASNVNSTLVFEEPEAHAFPPYIVHITNEIVDSISNQFVLSTHSPYILNFFLDNAIEDLAIFMVDFKNGETVINHLSYDDMVDIQKYGIDLFTNYETFLK